MTVRYYIKAEGYVQGVGFRYYVNYTAGRFGLTGWVRNREDGAVEMEVQGAQDAAEAFLEAIKEGNRYASVEDVFIKRLDPIAEHSFEVLYD